MSTFVITDFIPIFLAAFAVWAGYEASKPELPSPKRDPYLSYPKGLRFTAFKDLN